MMFCGLIRSDQISSQNSISHAHFGNQFQACHLLNGKKRSNTSSIFHWRNSYTNCAIHTLFLRQSVRNKWDGLFQSASIKCCSNVSERIWSTRSSSFSRFTTAITVRLSSLWQTRAPNHWPWFRFCSVIKWMDEHQLCVHFPKWNL